MASEIEIRSNIISLLKSNIGIGIEFFGLLSIDQLDDGRFRILNQEDKNKDLIDGEETIFEDAKKATDFFLAIRKKRSFGFDLEKTDE